MPNLRQDLIQRVFQTKASSSWTDNKSERIQVSLCSTKEILMHVRNCVNTAYHGLIKPTLIDTISTRPLPIYFLPFALKRTWGRDFTRWHLLRHHLWNFSFGYHAGRLEELLLFNRSCWSGEDVKDSVLRRSHWQQWWNWETTKQEVQNLATKTKVMWFTDENEAVNRTRDCLQRWDCYGHHVPSS